MNGTQTYPVEAVALHDDGVPWYPYRAEPTAPVLFLQEPVLDVPGAVWQITPPEFADRPHIRLNWSNLGELMFFACAPGDPYHPVEPEQVTADGLMPLLAGVLMACHCNPVELNAWMVDEYAGGLSNSFYRTRLADCRAVARRLVDGGRS